MGVVIDGYGGLGGGCDGGGGWYPCSTNPADLSHVRRCRPGAQLWVGSSRN